VNLEEHEAEVGLIRNMEIIRRMRKKFKVDFFDFWAGRIFGTSSTTSRFERLNCGLIDVMIRCLIVDSIDIS